LKHALEAVRALDDQGIKLLNDARLTAGTMPNFPAVLVIIAARFRRTAWKYEGIAYRLVLLEAGALIQTMCLVAEAIGLGCCALGCGNSDLFCELTGSDYYMETSIAELALGGRRGC
jgi:SagB-type dehydrogenase family enzyme